MPTVKLDGEEYFVGRCQDGPWDGEVHVFSALTYVVYADYTPFREADFELDKMTYAAAGRYDYDDASSSWNWVQYSTVLDTADEDW